MYFRLSFLFRDRAVRQDVASPGCMPDVEQTPESRLHFQSATADADAADPTELCSESISLPEIRLKMEIPQKRADFNWI